MKYDPKEDYAKWVEKVRIYEYGLALQRMAQGEPMMEIVEDMSRRITEKVLHPWLLKIKEDSVLRSEYDAEASKKSYEENYLKHNSPKPDHIVDNNEINTSGK
jgi:glutamyl-tRNA reductase